jgi:hypothetical protein
MKTLSSTQIHASPGLRHALAEILRRIDTGLPQLKEPVKMVIAGGVAVNFYCGERVTLDVDASFSRRIMLPEDLVVPYQTLDGKTFSVHFDRNYNTSFAVLHEDYEEDAVALEGDEFQGKNIRAFLLSPVDLAVSKIARFEGPDREDIAALAREGLISPSEVSARANEALDYFVGSTDRVRGNLHAALKLIEENQAARPSGKGK